MIYEFWKVNWLLAEFHGPLPQSMPIDDAGAMPPPQELY